jgi:hypothetical protein
MQYREVLMKRSTAIGLAVVASFSFLFSPASAGEASDFDALIRDRSLTENLRRTSHLSNSSLHPDFYSERHTTDCQRVRFPANGATLSQPIRLESRFYRERCWRDSQGDRRCEDRYVGSERRTVALRIEGRGEMLPWEEDVFNVCLAGYQLDARAAEASHQYRFGMPDMRGDLIVAFAGGKLTTDPDPAGIRLESFSTAEQAFGVAFSDRWARYYAGEDLALKLEVRQDRRMWGDETVLKKEVRLGTHDSYSVPLTLAEFGKRPEAGKKYFLKWSFQRLGRTSNPTSMGEWQTVSVDLGQSTSALKD